MLSLRKPSAESMRHFLAEQGKLPFGYTAVGATAETPPSGFNVDHHRIKLGEGEPVFRAAKAAVQQWKHFRLGWVELWSPHTPIRPGEVVAVMGRAMGLWWLNACRIVYVVDEAGPINKFGFAYGTLPGHVECGEERFAIEWHRAENSVWYDILAFSKPNHVLTRLGYPLVRRMQKRFRLDSAAAVLRAVSSGGDMNLAAEFLAAAINAFQANKRLADRAVEQVPDDKLHVALDANTNSIAVMMKHVAGNLASRWTDFLTTDGEKPWRDRDDEFVDSLASRAEMRETWERAWASLLKTLTSLKPEDLEKTVLIRGEPHSVPLALERSLGHTCYHIGQIVQVARIHAGDQWKTLTIPRGGSEEYNKANWGQTGKSHS